MPSILHTIPNSQQILSQVDQYIHTLPCFIEKVEYVEFWVGNAFQSSHFYADKFHMNMIAFQGLETGERQFRSYILQQNDIIFKITSHLQPHQCPTFQNFLSQHGDSIFDVAFRVTNTQEAFNYAIQHGAIAVTSPTKIFSHHNKNSYIEVASIKAPFATWQHTFINKSHFIEDEQNTFLPNFKSIPLAVEEKGYLEFIDHIAFAIYEGTLSQVIQWYHEALGFIRFLSNDDDDDENGLQIQTEDAQIGGLKTMVICPFSSFLHHDSHNVKFVMVEPKSSKSQIQEFLDFNNGTGAAHLAFHTNTIIEAVKYSKSKQVPFISVPFTYYESWRTEKKEIFEKINEDWENLKKYEILVDSNATWHFQKEGQEHQVLQYLLQTFTQPLTDRPTFYFEFICRKGADGFGKGNITSLFEAIARLQKQRGNL